LAEQREILFQQQAVDFKQEKVIPQQQVVNIKQEKVMHQPQAVNNKQEEVIHQQQAVNIKQEKIIPTKIKQEMQNTANSQQIKTEASTNVIARQDVTKASWTNVSSISPSYKVDSSVILNQISERTALRTTSVRSKISNTTSEQDLQNQLQLKTFNVITNANQISVGSPGTDRANLEAQIVNKAGKHHAAVSSKDDSRGQTSSLFQYVLKKSGHCNTSLKTATAVDSMVQKQNTQQWNKIKSGTILGTESVLKLHSAADFGGWVSKNSDNLKQMLTPVKIISPATNTARSSSAVTLPPSGNQVGGLLNNVGTTVSQDKTSTSQIPPVTSSELTALSIYERIATQLRHQEAIEDKALQNLAMAHKHVGYSQSSLSGKCLTVVSQFLLCHVWHIGWMS
jgi:hypothetical protein